MRNEPVRLATAAFCGLALLLALLLALFDTLAAVTLLAALVAGWALVVAAAVGRAVLARHRTVVFAAAGILALAALVVLRPGGRETGDAGGDEQPQVVESYAAEVWPNRLTGGAGFILRERVVAGGGAIDGRANLEAHRTGPLMREIRFHPGAASQAGPLRLGDGGSATLVINPIDDAALHHALGGDLQAVELPVGPVTRAAFDGLPIEMRVAYLSGAGRAFGWLASLATPLRRISRPLALLLFAGIGAAAALAWRERLVDPFGRRVADRRPRATGSGPGAPLERAPLVPRRK